MNMQYESCLRNILLLVPLLILTSVSCRAANEGVGGSVGERISAKVGVIPQLRVLTRIDGVSPETIYFSAQDSTDSACRDMSGGNDPLACASGQWLSYHFDFDDPESGRFNTTGNERNRQIGFSPRSIHTFICSPKHKNYRQGTCNYRVGVRVQNPKGEFADAFVTVRIQTQDAFHGRENTLCISPAGDFSGCPEGAKKTRNMPGIGSFTGKRVLLNRGEVHRDICIGYHERDVTIDAYGEGAAPMVPLVATGVDRSCRDRVPDNATAKKLPPLARDSAGNIISGWAYNITVTNIRAGIASAGVAGTLQTFHNLDLDWSTGGNEKGLFAFASNTNACMGKKGALDCSLVHWPYGIFLTDSVLRGNPEKLPNVNIACVNSCQLVNGGMAGNLVNTALEHNARFMGAWGLVVSNVWHQGNHIGGRGPKVRLRLSPSVEAVNLDTQGNPEEFTYGGQLRKSDVKAHWSPKHNFVFDSLWNNSEMDPEHDSAAFIALSSGHAYSGVFENKFMSHSATDKSRPQLRIGGVHVTARDNHYNSINLECRINKNLANGSQYHDPSRIFIESHNREHTKCPATEFVRILPPEPPKRSD